MALQDYLTINNEERRLEITEAKIMELLPIGRNYISYWREYPDRFVDFLKGPDSAFELMFYQRTMLRAMCRNKYFYATCPRAYSKSFMAFLAMMIKCILYPGARMFATSGTKEQVANIARDKITEICDLIPGIKNEIDWRPGKTTFSKDFVQVTFKNGSKFDIVAARDSARGGRRHSGILEEVILLDGTMVNQVILPLMNVSRKLPNGQKSDDNSPINKGQCYITTAGYRNTFSYDKLIQLLLWQVLYDDKSMVLGGTWRKRWDAPVKRGERFANGVA